MGIGWLKVIGLCKVIGWLGSGITKGANGIDCACAECECESEVSGLHAYELGKP
jgi:hypothetical protein